MRMSIVAFFLILAFSVYSQHANFRKGYIIGLENDTINGLVDFKLDEENMRFVDFIAEGEDEIKQYQPRDIAGYRLNDDGKFYVSKEVVIRREQPQMVFVEFLVQGVKNLYYYIENKKEYYLIEDGLGSLIVVSKKPDEVIDNRIVEDLKYRGILKYVFREYESVYQKTDKVNYSRKDMINLTKDYHDNVCTDGPACIVFENDYAKKFVAYEFAVYGSMQYHFLEFFTVYKRLYDNLIAVSVSPEVGGQVSVFFPRFSKSLGLFSDLSLVKIHGVKDYLYNDSELGAFNGKYEHKAYKINSMSGVKYVMDCGKIRPGFEAGLTLGYMFNQTNKLLFSKTVETDSDNSYEFYNHYLPLPVNVGYVVAIQIDYELLSENYVFLKLGCNKSFWFDHDFRLALMLKAGYIF